MRINREQVRRLMLRQEIQTFVELAENLGISNQALHGWFNGRAFSSGSLAALCRVLKCTPNDVLIWDEQREVAPKAMAIMGAMA